MEVHLNFFHNEVDGTDGRRFAHNREAAGVPLDRRSCANASTIRAKFFARGTLFEDTGEPPSRWQGGWGPGARLVSGYAQQFACNVHSGRAIVDSFADKNNSASAELAHARPCPQQQPSQP
ncbi:hypothetical protein V9T40_006585 [Parthenolecanium corni]|uniref:Uncharacterized protein n=1 Tax=Parthenolecanium corni TaxID=536013 RepID=A0AAN9TXY8_9HEMI